jgi:hypothetical protein
MAERAKVADRRAMRENWEMQDDEHAETSACTHSFIPVVGRQKFVRVVPNLKVSGCHSTTPGECGITKHNILHCANKSLGNF